MHPEFAQMLARERRTELLAEQQFRHRTRADTAPRAFGATSIGRARRSLGRAFVVLGSRLLGGEPAAVELFASRR
jgi:hypothetical protein